MKKTLFALSIAALVVGSTVAADTAFIEKAINKGQAGVIKACIKANFAIAPSRKQELLELAQQKVDKKEAALDSFSFASLSTYDTIHYAVSLAGMLALSKKAYDDWSYYNGKKSVWVNRIACAAGSLYAADLLLGLYTKAKKKDKKHESFEKAEKVLRAVENLPVTEETAA